MEYNPDAWTWVPDAEDDKLFEHYRYRKDGSVIHPDFYGVEKEAIKFGLQRVTFTDIFGIRWHGERGKNIIHKDPDYEQHLYYLDDETWIVDDTYTQDNFPEGFARIHRNHYCDDFVDIANIVKADYSYIVNNHLFKDSHINVEYDDGSTFILFDIFDAMKAIHELNPKLLPNLYEQIDRHFEGLKNSPYKDVRFYYPGTDARTYFEDNVYNKTYKSI